MAAMRRGSTAAWASSCRVRVIRWDHQSSGSCSAQPGWGEWMVISWSGWEALARVRPVSRSRIEPLMKELPRSKPRVNVRLAAGSGMGCAPG